MSGYSIKGTATCSVKKAKEYNAVKEPKKILPKIIGKN
jgi:hypothetical protein